MTEKELKQKSKFLSLVLRHRPGLVGIELDDQGWVNVGVLLQNCNNKGAYYDLPMLQYIVDNNNKKRFAFSKDKKRIRANQGHSVPINLAYASRRPPKFLYHGTAIRFVKSIQEQGLIKQNRHHVHLTADERAARKVGQRHGKAIVIVIKAKEMHESGIDFFLSDNGVWLTAYVGPDYLGIPTT